MQNTNEQQQNIDAATTGQSEDLQRAVTAAQTLCEWIHPSALAELVYCWSRDPETLPLAQIALDAGVKNCGAYALAEYLTANTDYTVDEEKFLADWRKAGLKFDAEHSSEPYAQAAQTHSERHKQAANQQHCTVCGENVGNDNLYWENPDLPNACSLVCESCMPGAAEQHQEPDTDGSWCDEESDAERNV